MQSEKIKDVAQEHFVNLLNEKMLHFNVPAGSDKSGAPYYNVYFLLETLPDFSQLTETTRADLQKVVDSSLQRDMRVSCDCPSSLYWGFEYILGMHDAQIGAKETRYPVVRNPKLEGVTCKHVARVNSNLFSYRMSLGDDIYSYLHEGSKGYPTF